MSTNNPVFILGTTRSGTSAIHLALLFALEHKGFGEGHFFETIAEVEKTLMKCFESNAVNVRGTFMNKLGTDGIRHELYEFYRNIFEKYVSKAFIDKTPSHAAIETAPFIKKVFPEAKIIYMQRRGIENVISKKKKFPSQSFESASNEWKQCIKTWNNVKRSLEDFLEIEQYNLKVNPQSEIDRISRFLDLTTEEQEKVFHFLTNKDIEKTSSKDAVDLEKSSFSEQEKSIFMNICGETMQQEGYSLTKSYFS